MPDSNQQEGMNIPQGLKKHPAGSKEKFGGLAMWASRRAVIQAIHDPVLWRQRGMGAIADQVQIDQHRELWNLEKEIEWLWQGELGELWRWKEKVDQLLLAQQLEVLALIQADDCRKGSGKWLALEGVKNLLGGLRDLLEKAR